MFSKIVFLLRVLGRPIQCQASLKWIRAFRNVHPLYLQLVADDPTFPFQRKLRRLC